MIRNIHKEYLLNNKKISVLKGIDLDINLHEITVILGRSGCGKTTLLRIISGLEQPTEGQIIQTHKLAFVFQEPRLMEWKTVKQNITFATKNDSNIDISSIIETVGLSGFENAYPHQLSGGMQQRVSIARALSYNPSLILMDEPFSALDYFLREQMQQELINVYQKTKCGILFVTHNIDEALLLGDKIIIIEHGKIKKQYDIGKAHYHKEYRDLFDEYFIETKKDIINNLNTN